MVSFLVGLRLVNVLIHRGDFYRIWDLGELNVVIHGYNK